MFSDRSHWNLAPNRLTTLLQQKQARGEPIIDLTNSNPTECGLDGERDDILSPLLNDQSLVYRPNPKGLRIARQAIANWYARQSITVDPEHIVLTSGTSEAYSFLFKLLCNAGEGVLVPSPSYPLFEFLTQLEGIRPTTYDLRYDGEWGLDFPSIKKSLTKRTRAILLLHPNNPTGSYIKLSEMKEINGIASQTRLPLIVDEVFYPFLLKENINRAQSFTGNSDVLTFTLGGISKLSGLPQMKLSWIVVSGPIREVEEACSRLEIISDTYLSVSTPIQYALSGYLHNEILFESILRRVRENFARLPGLVTGSPLSVLTCEGGWNTILQFPARATDEDWCERLLNSKGIYMHPGHFYGMEGAYLVCSLLGPPKPFTDAIRSVADFVRE